MIDPLVLLVILMVPIAAFVVAGLTIAALTQTRKLSNNIIRISQLNQSTSQSFALHNASR
ncbi:hypothetical protein [Alteromonas facilis]|uniref:hypothetical protein n=1 Tax=Alteromonas facilis TaxID=2048004 RepID=UPI000C284D87|nr:hypothetical protein [Alteromonas facilis]